MPPGSGSGKTLLEILKAILDNGKLEAAGFDRLFELGKLQLARLDQAINKGGLAGTWDQPAQGNTPKTKEEEKPVGLMELFKGLIGSSKAKLDSQADKAREGWNDALDKLKEQQKALTDAMAKEAQAHAEATKAYAELQKAVGTPGEAAANKKYMGALKEESLAEEASDNQEEERDKAKKKVEETHETLVGAQKVANKAPTKWELFKRFTGNKNALWGEAGEGAAGAAEGEAAGGAAEVGGAEAAGAAGGPVGLALVFGKKAAEKLKRTFEEFDKAWGSEKFGDVGSHLAKSSEIVTGMFGAMAARGFEAVEKLRKWNEELHEANMQFAEFSGTMAAVQARQEVRDIELSQKRGNDRAESAEYLASAKHHLNESVAPAEDAWAKAKNYVSGYFTEKLAVIVDFYNKGLEKLGIIAGNTTKNSISKQNAFEKSWAQKYGAEHGWKKDLGDPVTGR